MDISIHDVWDITIGPIQEKQKVYWRKIKLRTRRGTHEITCFEAPYARADKGEDLEITLAEEPM
tara:strand:+ start:1894 stop:2085 length:192 start_codon:yes stop_codon:yes gene_type:complete